MASQGWGHLLSPRSVNCSWRLFLLWLFILTVLEQGVKASTIITSRQAGNKTCQPANTEEAGTNIFTITTQEDADLLQDCTILQGSILIQSPNLTSLTLPNIQQINGYLSITTSPRLRSISAPNLTTASGLILKDLPLFSFKFPAELPLLSNPTYLDWENLPSMGDQFSASLMMEYSARMLRIVNTSMTSLSLDVSSVDVFNVSNNAYLGFIEMVSLVTVSQSLTISNNGYLEAPNIAVDLYSTGTYVGLDYLVTAGTIELSGVRHLDIGNLKRVTNGDLIFAGNIVTYPAYLELKMPNLTSINGALVIVDNVGLEYVSMNNLSSLQTSKDSYTALLVEGNTLGDKSWGTNLFFNALEVVHGSITIEGPIAEISLSSLPLFAVPVSINSTVLPFNCTSFDEIRRATIEYQPQSDQEPYLCRASPAGQTKDQAIHREKKSKLSKGAIAGIVVGTLIAVGILGVGIWWWFWGRKRRNVVRGDGEDEGGDDGNAEHELPMYRREALPGEEPPAYKENESVEVSVGGEEGDLSSVNESLSDAGAGEEHLDRRM